MRQDGILTQWDDSKGYGFITPKAGGAKLFVHINAFGLRAERPRLGEQLSFEPGADAQGKRRALNVRGAARPTAVRRVPAKRPSSAAVWLVPLFAAVFLLCQLLWPMPRAVWGAYMAMSLATFIVYFGDKRAARLNKARVPENTLHLLALACGWPGALLAQQLLRHKSSKPAFLRLFWTTALINLLIFVSLATPLREMLWDKVVNH